MSTEFLQSISWSDFIFIVVNSEIVPVAKFDIICGRRLSTKILHQSKIKRGNPSFFSF